MLAFDNAKKPGFVGEMSILTTGEICGFQCKNARSLVRSQNDQSRTDSTCLTQKSGSLEFRVAMPYMVVIRLSKPAIAFDIKVEPLEQSCIAKNTATAAFGCFDLIVRAFDKAAAKTTSK